MKELWTVITLFDQGKNWSLVRSDPDEN